MDCEGFCFLNCAAQSRSNMYFKASPTANRTTLCRILLLILMSLYLLCSLITTAVILSFNNPENLFNLMMTGDRVAWKEPGEQNGELSCSLNSAIGKHTSHALCHPNTINSN